jgi:hypothetical protein
MEATDLAAVERTRGGDTAAFRVLVERYGRSVFRLAFRMTGNEFDAEDVVQETFLRAYKQFVRVAFQLRHVALPDRGELLARSDPVAQTACRPPRRGYGGTGRCIGQCKNQ